MHTVHGSHHRYLVRSQDTKRLMKKRQNDLLLSTLPDDEYVTTTEGYYKCLICSYLPPFTSAEALSSHLKGKKHLQRLQTKLVSTSEKKQQEDIPQPSTAMPSLLYRTNEITKRVIKSNHDTSVPQQKIEPPPCSPEEPLWMTKMKEERKEREMIAKGFKKDDEGKWIRDETVEFDSDDEPTL